MASLCPLGRIKPEGDKPHTHDPCICLDDHDWDGTQTCMTCNVARCGATKRQGIGHVQCTRMRSHGNRHLFQTARRHTGPDKGS